MPRVVNGLEANKAEHLFWGVPFLFLRRSVCLFGSSENNSYL